MEEDLTCDVCNYLEWLYLNDTLTAARHNIHNNGKRI